MISLICSQYEYQYFRPCCIGTSGPFFATRSPSPPSELSIPPLNCPYLVFPHVVWALVYLKKGLLVLYIGRVSLQGIKNPTRDFHSSQSSAVLVLCIYRESVGEGEGLGRRKGGRKVGEGKLYTSDSRFSAHADDGHVLHWYWWGFGLGSSKVGFVEIEKMDGFLDI